MNSILRFVTSPITGWINFAVLALLMTLKWTGVITWSWWLVLIPMWLSMAVGLVIAAIAIYVLIVSASRGGG